MVEFIVRAHGTPTDPDRFLGEAGAKAHVEYLCQIIVAGLFIAKGHRSDVAVTLVMEHASDYSKAVTLNGDCLGSLAGLTEGAILKALADALAASSRLDKEQALALDNGIRVAATSFERLVKSRRDTQPIFLLDKKGADIREVSIDPDAVFLLTDHVPMPRNLHRSLIRQGAVPVSVGPVMLQASQCVSVVLNEVDRRCAGY